MPSVCQTIFQYISSSSSNYSSLGVLQGYTDSQVVGTSTVVCGDPLKFGVLILLGVVVFACLFCLGFYLMYRSYHS